MSQYTLYCFDYKTWEYQGARPAQIRPNGQPVLVSGSATATKPGLLKVGFAQVWRPRSEHSTWPYAHLSLKAATKSDEGMWCYIEDHRQEMDEQGRMIEENGGTGTPYWLPAQGDDWRSEARYVKELGPLPAGAVLIRPEKPLSVAQDEKFHQIAAGHESALAGAVALSDPTPSTVAVESALLAFNDAEGLEYVRDMLDARRIELEAMVTDATTRDEVESIKVSYPV